MNTEQENLSGKIQLYGASWFLYLQNRRYAFSSTERLIEFCNRKEVLVTNKDCLIDYYRKQLIR